MSSPLNFHLDQYEGPLDLLLDLIRKQQIDIKDIPIATITSQYLQYMEKAREMDIDLGAEFVYMAATLIHIKSKMLLPRDPALEKEGEAPEDPRQELVERLLEHERFKNAAEMLQQKRLIEENVWSNPQLKAFLADSDDPGLAVGMFDLVKALGTMLERAKTRPVYEVEAADVTVAGMIRYLHDEFKAAGKDKPVFIMRIFERQRTRRSMIALFLAVLEMVRMQAVILTQQDLFGEIALQRHANFDMVFKSDQPIAAIEKTTFKKQMEDLEIQPEDHKPEPDTEQHKPAESSLTVATADEEVASTPVVEVDSRPAETEESTPDDDVVEEPMAEAPGEAQAADDSIPDDEIVEESTAEADSEADEPETSAVEETTSTGEADSESAVPVESSEEQAPAEADGETGQGESPANEESEPTGELEAAEVEEDEPATSGQTVSIEEWMATSETGVTEAKQPDTLADEHLLAVLEACVYVAEDPLMPAQIANALNQNVDRVRELLDQLVTEFERPEHGLSIRVVAGGYKMATKPEHHDAVRNFVKSLKPPLKLSLPALETLAVIAYKQPVTSPEIMEIRGVQGGGVLKTLLDRRLITESGRKNVIGKPILYKTTKEFLIQFGLRDLAELPSLKEFEEIRRMAMADSEVAPPQAEAPRPSAELANSAVAPAAPVTPAAETGEAPESSAAEASPATEPESPAEATEIAETSPLTQDHEPEVAAVDADAPNTKISADESVEITPPPPEKQEE